MKTYNAMLELSLNLDKLSVVSFCNVLPMGVATTGQNVIFKLGLLQHS